MAIQTHFNKFDKAIYLTNHSADYKKATAKVKSILDEIKEKFAKEGFKVKDDFLQGSFEVNTAIRSLNGDYDVDKAIVIDASDAPTDPLKPKNAILDVLLSRNFQNPLIKMPCVTADYLSTNLHIDFTVYSKDQFGNYKLAVGKKGSSEEIKEWSPSDPEGLIKYIENKGTGGVNGVTYGENGYEKRKQFRRLVRFMKRWRDFTFSEEVKKKIFSIGLTVMIKNEYKPQSWTATLEDDLTVLKKVVDNILDGYYLRLVASNPEQYRLYVTLPCHGFRNIFNHKVNGGNKEQGSDKNVGTQFKNQLTILQKKLQQALDSDDEIKQCEILNGVFGDDFEVPSKSAGKKAGVAGVGAATFSKAGAAGTSQGADK